METILTLICNPGDGGHDGEQLDGGIVAEAAAALNGLGATTGAADWLSAAVACDIPFAGVTCEQAETVVRLHLQGFPVDVFAQACEGRAKRLLVADMDSTIVTTETLDDLAEFAGLGPEIAAITTRAMNGEIGFTDALRERVAMLEGLDAGYLEKTMAGIALTAGAETLVRTMARNDAPSLLVSGGFTCFADKIAERAGFAAAVANRLDIIGGRLTGTVAEPIVNNDAKLAALKDFAAKHGVAMADSMAVGDGANDLKMLQAAGLGVAYHAKPVVAERARARIEHGDLAALLYLQGYRADDFA